MDILNYRLGIFIQKKKYQQRDKKPISGYSRVKIWYLKNLNEEANDQAV